MNKLVYCKGSSPSLSSICVFLKLLFRLKDSQKRNIIFGVNHVDIIYWKKHNL